MILGNDPIVLGNDPINLRVMETPGRPNTRCLEQPGRLLSDLGLPESEDRSPGRIWTSELHPELAEANFVFFLESPSDPQRKMVGDPNILGH